MSGAVAVLATERNLGRYLAEIRKFPLLEPGQEFTLAKRWAEQGDREAGHELITSHLRLVAKIAMRYRRYGLPASEVMSEGNVGLMQAVKRFDPDKGFRLATYATWWIKAAIQEYVLRSWSLVKIGTTANQKKLFFNLRKAKSQISALNEGDLRPDQVTHIAIRLGVTEQDVVTMNRRLGGDVSLNAPLREEGEGEWQDWLVDGSVGPDETLVIEQEGQNRLAALRDALSVLDPRERRIFEGRRLSDEPLRLEDLSDEFGISRERVRQLEARAFAKVQEVAQKSLALRETSRAEAAAKSKRAKSRQDLGRTLRMTSGVQLLIEHHRSPQAQDALPGHSSHHPSANGLTPSTSALQTIQIFLTP
jgi:RNA polymerase sigma-32 factor